MLENLKNIFVKDDASNTDNDNALANEVAQNTDATNKEDATDNATEERCKLTIAVNDTIQEIYGNSPEMFKDIQLGKVTTKAKITFEKGDKKMEMFAFPVKLKRLAMNDTARIIAFKQFNLRLK